MAAGAGGIAVETIERRIEDDTRGDERETWSFELLSREKHTSSDINRSGIDLRAVGKQKEKRRGKKKETHGQPDFIWLSISIGTRVHNARGKLPYRENQNNGFY